MELYVLLQTKITFREREVNRTIFLKFAKCYSEYQIRTIVNLVHCYFGRFDKCATFRPCSSLFRSNMPLDAVVMTCERPLLHATYEVTLLRISLGKSILNLAGFKFESF